MKRFSSSILAFFALNSFTSALTLPNADDLLTLSILSGSSHALVDLDILVNVLGPSQCSNSALIGLEAQISLFNLIHICACIEVLNINDKNTACPQCVSNAHPICGLGSCGCECDEGYFATTFGTCVSIHNCPAPNTLVRDPQAGNSVCNCHAPEYISDNAGGCVCAAPYVPASGSDGGCVLPPSARARLVKAKKSQLALDAVAVVEVGDAVNVDVEAEVAAAKFNEARCPDGETACPLGSGEGWECLDVTSSLDSCGGCPSKGGVNCLTIPGALGVSCVESKCEISSCFPGWRYAPGGRCVR